MKGGEELEKLQAEVLWVMRCKGFQARQKVSGHRVALVFHLVSPQKNKCARADLSTSHSQPPSAFSVVLHPLDHQHPQLGIHSRFQRL